MKLFILEGEDWNRFLTTFFIAESMEKSIQLMGELYDKWKPISTKRNAVIDAFAIKAEEFYADKSSHLQWCEDTIDALWAEYDTEQKLNSVKGSYSIITALKRHQRDVINKAELVDTIENQRYKHSTYQVQAVEQSLGLEGSKAECIERWKTYLREVETNTFIDNLSTDVTVVL